MYFLKTFLEIGFLLNIECCALTIKPVNLRKEREIENERVTYRKERLRERVR